jgi:hypothetical protein
MINNIERAPMWQVKKKGKKKEELKRKIDPAVCIRAGTTLLPATYIIKQSLVIYQKVA